MERSDKIELLTQPNKVGISMIKIQYNRIANFISTTLDTQEYNRIKINELLDLARKELDHEFYGNVSWYLLKVKNDMVVRGLINMVFTLQREQMIIKASSRSMKNQRRNPSFPQHVQYSS
jgi:ferritin